MRPALAGLVARGVLQLHHPEPAGHARIARLFEKYADQDPDWADMELVWLAEAIGITRIATIDVADFSVYRIQGCKREPMVTAPRSMGPPDAAVSSPPEVEA